MLNTVTVLTLMVILAPIITPALGRSPHFGRDQDESSSRHSVRISQLSGRHLMLRQGLDIEFERVIGSEVGAGGESARSGPPQSRNDWASDSTRRREGREGTKRQYLVRVQHPHKKGLVSELRRLAGKQHFR